MIFPNYFFIVHPSTLLMHVCTHIEARVSHTYMYLCKDIICHDWIYDKLGKYQMNWLIDANFVLLVLHVTDLGRDCTPTRECHIFICS